MSEAPFDPRDIAPRLPAKPFPILVIGTGGIVKDAHLPAYKMAGFPVWGLYNRTRARADELAAQYGIENVFDDLDAAIAAAPADAIFDIALPASMFADALRRLPHGSHVLIQKPMGEDLSQAREVLDVCRDRGLHAAINCQLRFAPFVMAARRLIDDGLIGDLIDMEMRLTTMTPWELFPFLNGLPRMEIVYHSVHYVDLIRSFLGDPRSVHARTVPHPLHPDLAQVCSAILMDYPSPVRATITTNHLHRFGPKHQESYLKWEGTKGAIKARVGLLMNYPHGVGDEFEYCLLGDDGKPGGWQAVKLEGSWFPEAFIGSMAQVQCHKEGTLDRMAADVSDVIHTMACVEAAYESDRRGGVRPDQFL
ncbi:MAG: Gfo/Idh/MocA family oxidoreductase [Verrucomicrobiae bacterium]|nr:Gfo/Idh/MocA family oxidoreductase [Verrucomicrobiae bacterium]